MQQDDQADDARQDDAVPQHGLEDVRLPPHLVRRYLSRLKIGPEDLVLDPFCGTGTTLVEAKKNGIPSLGCDAHPFAALVSRVKTNWAIDTKLLQ